VKSVAKNQSKVQLPTTKNREIEKIFYSRADKHLGAFAGRKMAENSHQTRKFTLNTEGRI